MTNLSAQAPLITSEEITTAEIDFNSLLERKAALMLVNIRVDEGIARHAETAAALILVTNLLVMQRSPRGVIKFAQISSEQTKVPGFAISNLVRGLLTGEFSALVNFEHWIDILDDHSPVPADVRTTAETSIQFLESYSARQRLAMDETADFFLSFNFGEDFGSESVFTVDEPFYGAITIACGENSKRFYWSEYFKQRGVTVRYLQRSSHLMLDLDFTAASVASGNVVEDWISALQAIEYLGMPAVSSNRP